MERIVLVLLGKRGAGKSSIAKLFASKGMFTHIEMSGYLNGIKESMKSNLILRKFVEQIHKENGATYFVDQLYNDCLKDAGSNVVVTGIRHMSEKRFLIQSLQDRKLIFIYLKVSFIRRWLRIHRRVERNSAMDFLIEEYYSEKWGNRELKASSPQFSFIGDLSRTFIELSKFLMELIRPDL